MILPHVCRSLYVLSSDSYFLSLAPSSLDDLTCGTEIATLHEQPDITRITEHTALTSLALKGYRRYTNLDSLHSLRLQQLRLINGFCGEWPAVDASAFPFLHTLHITDEEGIPYDQNWQHLARRLDQLGKTLCSMPKLKSLSGNGILMAVAQIGGLHPAWQLSASSQHAENGGIYTWERSAVSESANDE